MRRKGARCQGDCGYIGRVNSPKFSQPDLRLYPSSCVGSWGGGGVRCYVIDFTWVFRGLDKRRQKGDNGFSG